MTAGARTARTQTLAIKRNGCGRISDVYAKSKQQHVFGEIREGLCPSESVARQEPHQAS